MTGRCSTCDKPLDGARYARCEVCVGKTYCPDCARAHFCMDDCPARGCKPGLCTREVISPR